TIANGAGSTTFRYKTTVAESLTLTGTDNAADLTAATLNVQTGPDRLAVTGTTPIKSGTCQLYTVTSQDAALSTTGVLVNTQVNLDDGGAAGAFFAAADNTCAGANIANVSIAAGGTTAQFRYKDDTAQNITLSAADNAAVLTTGTLNVSIGPDHFELTGTSPVKAGTCNTFTVTTKDTANNTANVVAATQVNLDDGGAAGVFYATADATCSGAPIASVNIANGAGSATFRYKDDTGQAVTLSAADNAAGGLTTSTFNLTVGPNRLVILGSTAIESAACELYDVRSRDVAGNNVNVLAATQVNLTDGAAAGVFYAAADNTCAGAPIANVSIAMGQSLAQFRYKTNVAESLTLDAADNAADLTSGTLNVQSGPDHLVITATTPALAGTCNVITVKSQDFSNNDANVLTNVTVNISDGGAAGTLHAIADATCSGAATTSVTIANGAGSAQFRYKNNTAETAALAADDAAGNLTSASFNFTTGPDRLAITGSQTPVTGTCVQYTVHARDAQPADANVLAATTVNLGDAGAAGDFYAAADNTCVGANITQISIANGAPTATFYYKTNSAAAFTLTASDNAGSLTSGSLNITSGPSKIIITGSTPVESGACTPYTVKTQDAGNADANVLVNTTININDGGAAGTLYAGTDNTCAGAAVTSVSIASGNGSATFYYKDDTAQNVTLNAVDAAAVLTAGSLNIVVGPDRLTLAGPASVKAGTCSAAFTITTKDTAGNTAGVSGATTVNLADGSATGTFHELADCSDGAVTSVSLALGVSTKQFYFKDTTGAALTITVSDNAAGGLTSATSNITIGPDRLELTGAGTPVAGSCQVYTVTSQDQLGNATAVLANTQVNLDDGGASGVFYAAADNTCSGAPIANVTISASSSSTTFRYKDNTAEAVTLTGTDNAGNLTADTLNITVGPNHLIITGNSPINAGSCQLYTVTSRDATNTAAAVLVNTQVNLGDGAASGVFYAAADNTCAGAPVANVTIPAASSSITFRYKDDVAEPVTLTGTDNAAVLTAASTNITVGPDHFIFSAAPSAVKSGSCSAVFTVQSKDTANNTAAVVGATQVNLADGSATGTFHAAADNTCAGAAITSVNIANGQSSASFYFKDSVAAQLTITASDNAGSITQATSTLDVYPSKLIFTGNATPPSGSCQLYTVKTQDFASNDKNVIVVTQVNLTDDTANGNFYAAADNTCAGAPIASVTIANGAGSTTFRYKTTVAESLTLTGTDNAADLTAATLNITAGPDRLDLTGSTPINSGACELYTVTSKDPGGNTAAVLVNTQVNLGDGAAAGDFYAAADNTCAGAPIANITINSGLSSGTFRYKDNTAQSVTLSVADNATVLTGDTLNVGVGPNHFVITGTTPQIAGTCGTFTVKTQDATNTDANVLANTQVDLSDGAASGVFYAFADNTCAGAPIASVTIANGAGAAQFRYKNNKAETATLDADDNAASLTSASFNYTTGPDRLVITGQTQPASGACELYTVKSQDAQPADANTLAAVTIDLTDTSATGDFFAAADNTCAGATITDISIALGGGSAQFRYKNTVAENGTLTATDRDGNLTTGTLNTVTGPDRIDISGAASVKSGVCTAITVTTRDGGGNAANVLANTQINLADGSATGNFYAVGDNTCAGGTIGNVTLATGNNAATVYFKDNVAAQLTLTASDNATVLTSDSLTLDVGPDRFDLAGPTSVKAGVCSAVFTVTTKDAAGNTAGVLGATQVNLADGSATGTFHTANDCSDGAKTSVNIAGGASSATFYFKDTVGAQRTITVTDNAAGGLSSDSSTIDVGPDHLVITGAASPKAGTCVQYTVKTQDAANNDVNALAAITVNVGDSGAAGSLHAAADNTCAGAAITQVTIGAGSGSATFYYKDDTAEAVTLTAADAAAGGLTSGSLNINVGPDRLDLTGTTPVVAGACSVFTVTSKDATNTAANALVNTQVNLSDDSATGDFYALADNTCAGAAITNVTISSGTSAASFRYKDPKAESVVLTVADNAAGGLSGDTFNLAVGPDRIVITAGPTNVKSNVCSSAFTVKTRDAQGTDSNVLANTQVNLADGSATGTFHTANDCSDGAKTFITLNSGTNTGTFYFKDTTGASLTITASDDAAVLTSGTRNITVGPDRLIITGSQTPPAGSCQLYTVRSRDANGNDVNVGANLQVNLTDDTANGGFYAAADNTCSGAAITDVTITSGSATTTFRYKNNVGESYTLTATDNAADLTTGTLAVTTGPDRITITGSSPIKAGVCTAYTVTTKDAATNTKAVLANTQIDLTDGSADGAFYGSADNTCAGAAITNFTLANGSSTATVYFKDDKAEALTLTAADNATVLTSGTVNVTIGPDRIDLAGPASVKADTCSAAFTVTTRDAQGTAANVVANTQVNLADGSATGTFHTSNDCSDGAKT
ncbi:MAG TPA: hypothetical protein VFV50_12470, partial [Bdellovibrionales bacterium]|nr:hypothetical protein [Bdellovibrionales bacterium]